jgi:hypothetical protein
MFTVNTGDPSPSNAVSGGPLAIRSKSIDRTHILQMHCVVLAHVRDTTAVLVRYDRRMEVSVQAADNKNLFFHP